MPMRSVRSLSAHSAMSERLETRLAAREVAETLHAASSSRPDVLFVFASFHHRALLSDGLDVLRHALHPSHLLATTVESAVWNDREIERKPSLSVLALHAPGIVARPFWFDLNDGPPAVWGNELIRQRVSLPPDEGVPAGTQAGAHGGALEHRATILIADPFSLHPGDACAAIDAAAGPCGARIHGGIASGANHAGLNVLAVDRHVANAGIVGLSIFGDIEVSGLVSQGCRPIGKPLVVTRGHGNEILELNGRAATETIQEAVAELRESERALLGQGLLMGIALDASKELLGRGDFLVRPVLAVDPARGSVSISDRVRAGMTVRLQIRDRATADDDLAMMLDAEQLRDPVSAALLFTCNARGTSMFGTPDHDASMLRRRLGGMPLSGFQCAGEIGPHGARSFVHTQTASAVLFRQARWSRK